MDKIEFHNTQNWKSVIPITITVICILLAVSKPIPIGDSRIYQLLGILGLSIQTFFLAKLFWCENHVLWNKKGFTLKMGSFKWESLRFDEIKSVDFRDNELEIVLSDNREKMRLDLSKIESNDRVKLNQVLQKNLRTA